MQKIEITNQIKYIGADDKEITLFEGQYDLPNGMSYNSYLIKDEKNIVMDTIRKRVKWRKSRLFSYITLRTRPCI